jgi:alkylation response protein AidB-like acyl-CoA dehydrogenase
MGLREIGLDITDEHAAIWKTTKEFVTNVWRPADIELDQMSDPEDVIAEGSVLWDVVRKSHQLGYHALGFPRAYGGGELDPLGGALVGEAFGWASPGLGTSVGVSAFPFMLCMFSPESELQDYARKFCADTEGKMMGCWANMEPDHGSDWLLEEFDKPACAPNVTATLDGDHYILNGQKAQWVSNGTIAKYASMNVVFDWAKGKLGIAFVPLDLPGISRGKPLNKLGKRAMNQGEIFFDDVKLPKQYMVASDPESYRMISDTLLCTANCQMGNLYVGVTLSAFEEALAYAKKRIQGGKPIIEHHNIKLKLCEMFTQLEASRSLARRVQVYNMEMMNQKKPPAIHYAAISKTFCTETAFRVAHEAMQIHGGNGISKDFLIEKIFRDARMSLIEDCTSDILSIHAMNQLKKGPSKYFIQK